MLCIFNNTIQTSVWFTKNLKIRYERPIAASLVEISRALQFYKCLDYFFVQSKRISLIFKFIVRDINRSFNIFGALLVT